MDPRCAKCVDSEGVRHKVKAIFESGNSWNDFLELNNLGNKKIHRVGTNTSRVNKSNVDHDVTFGLNVTRESHVNHDVNSSFEITRENHAIDSIYSYNDLTSPRLPSPWPY